MSCNTEAKNLGYKCQLPKGRPTAILMSLSRPDLTIEQAQAWANWETLLQKDDKDSRVYYLPCDQVVVADDTMKTETLDGNKIVQLADEAGQDQYKIHSPSDNLIQNLFAFDGATVYIAYLYANGFVRAKSSDGLSFEFLKAQTFVGTNKSNNDASEKAVLSVQIDPKDVKNSKEFIKTISEAACDFEFDKFYSLQDAEIVILTSSATALTFTYKTKEGFNIAGLTKPDVTVKNGGGVSQTTTALTSSSVSGEIVYTLTYPSLSAGTYTLDTVTPGSMALKGFETVISDTFVVGS